MQDWQLAVAGGAGFYLAGKVHDDNHQRETGILAGEAAVNSLIVAESFKLIYSPSTAHGWYR